MESDSKIVQLKKGKRIALAKTGLVALVLVFSTVVGGALYLLYYATPAASLDGSAVPSSCTLSFPNGAGLESEVHLTATSPAEICVRFYYYNSTSTKSFSTLKHIEISGAENEAGTNGSFTYNATSLFTIVASTNQIQLGGPSNVEEGSIVVYQISTSSNTPNEQFWIGLNSTIYSSQADCGSQLVLDVGNAPYSGGGGMCLSLPGILASTNSVEYQHQTNGHIQGFLYDEIVGITNSTINTSP